MLERVLTQIVDVRKVGFHQTNGRILKVALLFEFKGYFGLLQILHRLVLQLNEEVRVKGNEAGRCDVRDILGDLLFGSDLHLANHVNAGPFWHVYLLGRLNEQVHCVVTRQESADFFTRVFLLFGASLLVFFFRLLCLHFLFFLSHLGVAFLSLLVSSYSD